jgi:hypothetical protein
LIAQPFPVLIAPRQPGCGAPNPHVSMARSCWAGFSAGTSAGGAALTEVMAMFGSRNG